MDFKEGIVNVDAYQRKHSGHASAKLLKAYLLRWKHSPITEANDSIFALYKETLQSAEELAKASLKGDSNNPEMAYYLMTSYIMRAELLAWNDEFMKAALEGKSALQYIKKGFEWCIDYPEFYVSTGLYNYYIEFYRDKGFFYQSALWPFPKGNKKDGLAYLMKGESKATFSKVENTLYLAHLYFKMENNPQAGIKYISKLRSEFPNNYKFVEMEVENLIAIKDYTTALASLNSQKGNTDRAFLAKQMLFKGIIDYENKSHDQANDKLNKALTLIDNLPGDNDHYISLSHYYRAMLYYQQNDYDLSEKYLKKAKDKAKYPFYKSKIESLESLL